MLIRSENPRFFRMVKTTIFSQYIAIGRIKTDPSHTPTVWKSNWNFGFSAKKFIVLGANPSKTLSRHNEIRLSTTAVTFTLGAIKIRNFSATETNNCLCSCNGVNLGGCMWVYHRFTMQETTWIVFFQPPRSQKQGHRSNQSAHFRPRISCTLVFFSKKSFGKPSH